MTQLIKLKKGHVTVFLALLTLMSLIEILLFKASFTDSLKMQNISTAAATMLFCGTYILDRKKAVFTGLTFVLIPQIVNAFRTSEVNLFENVFVLIALVILAGLGFFVQRNIRRQTIMVASLIGSILVYLFMYTGKYMGASDSLNFAESVVGNLRYFRGLVIGDLLFNLVLFGSYGLICWIAKQNSQSN